MKKPLIVFGFILSALAGLALMQARDFVVQNKNPWSMGEAHMQRVEADAQSMLDKCKLDRMQGRLKGYAESAECSNPSLRAAFQKEGFPDMDDVDIFLKQRLQYAKMADSQQITESKMRELTDDDLAMMLESVENAEPKQ
jgi:hypothetical protein